MKIRQILLTGLCTGALVGLLTALITRSPVMYWWWSAVLTFFSIVFASSYIVRFVSSKLNCCQPSLKQLVPIACLTFFMPVLGPVFGGSGDLLEIPTIALLGALGGLFWSLPFALSTWLQNKKQVSRMRANFFAILAVLLLILMGNAVTFLMYL